MSLKDPSTWPQYAAIDPEFQAVIDALGGPQNLPSMSAAPDVPALRAMVSEMMAQAAATAPPPDYSGIKKSDVQIPVRDGATIRGVLYAPETVPSSGSPLAVIYHGGGFCIGVPEMEEPLALEVVRSFGGVALSVDYRMAPEFKFPVPIDDSWDALKWAASNAKTLGADPSKGFIIGGTSAGAIISCVISHIARDEKLSPRPTGVWLNVPHVVDNTLLPAKYKGISKSEEQNKDAPILGQQAIDFFMANYAPDVSDPKHSPLLWPGEGHKNLPPHLIQAAGLDPLRDDALIYSQALQEDGIPTQTYVYPGVPHGFDSMFAGLSLAKKFAADRSKWLSEQFGK